MRNRWGVTGLAFGILALLISIGPFISSYEHLLLKSILLYFGFAYTTSSLIYIIGYKFDDTPLSFQLFGYVFVFIGIYLISFTSFEVWPGTSTVSGWYSIHGLAWSFISVMMYSVFNYGLSRRFASHILSVSMLFVAMYPLLDATYKVIETGSVEIVTEHLLPLLLIYAFGIIASIPLYISGQSIEMNRQITTRVGRSKPIAFAAACSIYVVSFLIGVSYYHPPLQDWGSVSFIGVTIIPVLVVTYFTWKKSFHFTSNPLA